MSMKTGIAVLAFGLLALAATPLVSASGPSDTVCVWNHSTLPDQYVTYTGYFTETVGVRFIDGSPFCEVQVVCGGTLVWCSIPPV